jgi:hypothetical protein
MSETKVFDLRTTKGYTASEKYQARLYSKYDKVTVTPVGLNRVRISGTHGKGK